MKLTSLKNIGEEMERKLNTVGINSVEELIEAGSKEAFFRLKAAYPQVCLVHLYTLQAAIENIDMNMLSKETKADLKLFSDGISAT